MKDMLNVYQPSAFGTAWGNDPDYIKLTSKLKKSLVKNNIIEEPGKSMKGEVSLAKSRKSKGH
jgi:hypothetical protein